tara:strand:- start:280 stop:759 length:480 start_codon:yes stop_codon:yes gene_type:complete
MYAFMIVSTIYIFNMIYNFYKNKPISNKIEDNEYNYLFDYDNYINKLYDDFPSEHYYNRYLLFNYLSKDENFNRLEKIFDNSLYNRMEETIENNKILKEKYELLNIKLGDNLFSYKNDLQIPIKINDKEFNTSFGYLNFVRWFLENDFFLYIYKIENEN